MQDYASIRPSISLECVSVKVCAFGRTCVYYLLQSRYSTMKMRFFKYHHTRNIVNSHFSMAAKPIVKTSVSVIITLQIILCKNLRFSDNHPPNHSFRLQAMTDMSFIRLFLINLKDCVILILCRYRHFFQLVSVLEHSKYVI